MSMTAQYAPHPLARRVHRKQHTRKHIVNLTPPKLGSSATPTRRLGGSLTPRSMGGKG